jgi:hypothetical protein
METANEPVPDEKGANLMNLSELFIAPKYAAF